MPLSATSRTAGARSALAVVILLALRVPSAEARQPGGGASATGTGLDLRITAPPEENLTVRGQRRRFTAAPVPGGHAAGYGEGADRIRDTMTGADLSAFGNAYNLGSVMGSDERGNETGGPYVAPRHP